MTGSRVIFENQEKIFVARMFLTVLKSPSYACKSIFHKTVGLRCSEDLSPTESPWLLRPTPPPNSVCTVLCTEITEDTLGMRGNRSKSPPSLLAESVRATEFAKLCIICHQSSANIIFLGARLRITPVLAKTAVAADGSPPAP